jgi:hypothetical protein
LIGGLLGGGIYSGLFSEKPHLASRPEFSLENSSGLQHGNLSQSNPR